MVKDRKLGDRIRELRESHPTYRSLRQFADVLRKSPSWVSKVERNQEKPGRETLLEIARLLEVNADELLELAELLDPEIEKQLTQRYAEVSGLLRTIKDLTPQQIAALEEHAKQMRGSKGEEQK